MIKVEITPIREDNSVMHCMVKTIKIFGLTVYKKTARPIAGKDGTYELILKM